MSEVTDTQRTRGKMASFDPKVDFLSPQVSSVNPFGSPRMSGGASGSEKTVDGIDLDSDYANGLAPGGSGIYGEDYSTKKWVA